jgi:G3E family GTPase
MNTDNRIPVTIITGFLGGGKTTLLNELIKEHPEKEFAIIENEFGEIGIDAELILSQDDNIFELSNGCICCSIHEGFYETITKLVNSPHSFNHLLIETTGIADPDSIIQAFLTSKEIESKFRIESVICIADCKHMGQLIEEQAEVRKQIALADVILLNKADRVEPHQLEELKSLIGKINCTAQLFPTQFAKLENINLLDLKAFSASFIEEATLTFRNQKSEPHTNHGCSTVESEHHHHKHDIVSMSFSIPGSFDMHRFSFWIQNYLFLNSTEVFRVKGIISFSNSHEKHVFQAVRENYIYEPGTEWGDSPRFNKLVFIGKNLNRVSLEESLYQLLSS